MSGNSAFLRLAQFWRFYVRLDETPLDGEVLNLFGTTTINGTTYAQSTISLRCGQDCFMDLTITPQMAMLNLDLRNRSTGRSCEMGWWDEARWHPFALRYSLRNREHAGGDEGQFPFAEWARIVAQLPAAADAT